MLERGNLFFLSGFTAGTKHSLPCWLGLWGGFMTLGSRSFPEGLLAKMALLEARLGPWTAGDFVPSKFNFRDPIHVQRIAKEMASSVGMGDLSFIVTYARQADKVGGHIELNAANNAVFVEIDTEYELQESVLAILAHELAHKYLHRRGISLPVTQDNEELTDLATIFMGFGSLSLNGCHTTQTTQRTEGNTVHKTTKEWKVGYLGRTKLAIAFYLHGLSARQIPGELTRHLHPDAAAEVDRIAGEYAWLRAFDRDAFIEQVPPEALPYQKDVLLLASLTHALRVRINDSLQRYHSWVMTIGPQIEALKIESSLPMIRALATLEEAGRKESEFIHEQRPYRWLFENLDWKTLDAIGLAKAEKIQIGCPRCGSELRIRNQAMVQILRCPKCTLTFEFAGPLAGMEKSRQEPTPIATVPKRSWIQRVFRRGS